MKKYLLILFSVISCACSSITYMNQSKIYGNQYIYQDQKFQLSFKVPEFDKSNYPKIFQISVEGNEYIHLFQDMWYFDGRLKFSSIGNGIVFINLSLFNLINNTSNFLEDGEFEKFIENEFSELHTYTILKIDTLNTEKHNYTFDKVIINNCVWYTSQYRLDDPHLLYLSPLNENEFLYLNINFENDHDSTKCKNHENHENWRVPAFKVVTKFINSIKYKIYDGL